MLHLPNPYRRHAAVKQLLVRLEHRVVRARLDDRDPSENGS